MNKLKVKVVLLTVHGDEGPDGGNASVACDSPGNNPCKNKWWSSVAIIWGGIEALFSGHEVVVPREALESGAPHAPVRRPADVKSPPS